MYRKSTLAVLILTAFAASMVAQTKPNFSGTWKLNVAKSDFGVLPAPDNRTDIIDHNEPAIKINTNAESAQGKQTANINYTTDGKEVTNQIGPREVKSTVTWEGANLVVNSKLSFNDQDVTIKNVWTLSEDGKTLTENAHLASPMGETDQKLVFDKQEAGAVASAAPATPPASSAPAAATAAPSTTAGHVRPNFSGTWKLDLTKSDFGVLPPPNSRTDVIEHSDPALKVTTAEDGQQGKQDYSLNLTTDGKEATNNAAGLELKSILNWEGSNLVMNTKLKFQDNDVTIKDVWNLSEDGKTLTRNAHLESPMGETDQKLVFSKLDNSSH